MTRYRPARDYSREARRYAHRAWGYVPEGHEAAAFLGKAVVCSSPH